MTYSQHFIANNNGGKYYQHFFNVKTRLSGILMVSEI